MVLPLGHLVLDGISEFADRLGTGGVAWAGYEQAAHQVGEPSGC